MQKALIIGSGVAGIASSIRLAHKGYEVHVFEKNTYPGGKLTSFRNQDFRFDAGPSLFTMPNLVTELFELCGEDPEKHFGFKKLDTICNYFWEDGKQFSMPSSEIEQVAAISKSFQEPSDKVKAYLRNSKEKYELTAPLFIEKSLHKISTYLSTDMLKALFKLPRLGIFSTLHKKNTSSFSNPSLIQLFNRFATYNGSSPYKCPGIMSMIPHLEMNIGTFFPEGGMESITNSLVQLAERQGVQFHYESFVNKIRYKNKKAIGLTVNQQEIDGDIVVSNMDVFSTYSILLNKLSPPQKTLSQERSSSALIFYWGIDREFEELDLHNILFSDSYKEEFEHIFDKNGIHDDPTVYINISSKENKSDAPKNCENWFVMINTPSDTGQDWDHLIKEARNSIIEKVNRTLKIDISDHIVTENILTPQKIGSKTMSYQGALYGTSSNSRYAAFLRHSNFSHQLQNLFFCGGSVHPGGGIPLCLNSAKIVCNFID